MLFDDPTTAAPVPAHADAGADALAVGQAWLLRDVTHVPGVLILRGGQLRFVSTRRVVFDGTPDELELTPRRGRRGRFRLTVDGERLGLSVVRLPGAVAVPADLLARTIGLAPSAAAGAIDDAVARWNGLLAPGTVERRRARRMARALDRTHPVVETRRSRTLRVLTSLVPRRREEPSGSAQPMATA